MFSSCVYNSILHCSTPGTTFDNTLKIFDTFFRTVSRITLVHAYIRHFVYVLSYITAVIGYIRVGPYA